MDKGRVEMLAGAFASQRRGGLPAGGTAQKGKEPSTPYR